MTESEEEELASQVKPDAVDYVDAFHTSGEEEPENDGPSPRVNMKLLLISSLPDFQNKQFRFGGGGGRLCEAFVQLNLCFHLAMVTSLFWGWLNGCKY